MKRLILKTAILLAIFLTISATNAIAQDMNSAILLTRSEQYDKAKEMFEQLIQDEPGNSKYYFYLGENYLIEYFADTISNSLTISANAAKEVYQQGVDANPNDPLNYIGLAKVAHYLGDEQTATDMRAKAKSFLLPYKNLRRISPPAQEYAYTLAKIAESYIKEDEVDTSAALPLIREAIKIDNKNRDVYLIAGDIWILTNDGSKAIMNYNQAQFADPESPTALMKIGNIYRAGRILNSAIPNYEEAIALNPDFAPAYRELGQLYLSAGRYEQSKEYFKKYLELTAGNIPARTRYVNALYYAKDYDGVIENVEEIFKVDQSRTYMNRIAGYSCYEKDPPDYNKALEYMETLFATVDPERIIEKDYHYLARILIKKNQDYTKMVDELNSLKQKGGNNADRIATLEKDITRANSELERAFDAYAKVLEYDPEDKYILNEIAVNNFNLRRYEDAAKAWEKLIDPEADNTEEYMRIGRAYYTAEKYKAADSIFNIVIAKSPEYVDAHALIARTYHKMDPDMNLGLAKPKFTKLLSIASKDSVEYESEIMEALIFLSYYNMIKENYNASKDYYNRMINLNPNNKQNIIRGYNGIGSIETRIAGDQATIEGRLAILTRAAAAYNKALAIDPANASAKGGLAYVREFEALVRKGINPNEIKGVIKDAAGKPIPYASVRVKDTAAENFTNANGEYKFEIPSGMEFLIISADGYISKEIPITSSRTYNVTLEK